MAATLVLLNERCQSLIVAIQRYHKGAEAYYTVHYLMSSDSSLASKGCGQHDGDACRICVPLSITSCSQKFKYANSVLSHTLGNIVIHELIVTSDCFGQKEDKRELMAN
jgi:hypothetical protein